MNWISIEEKLPEADRLVQVRVQAHDGPYVAIGYRSFPMMSDGRIPISEIPLEWYSSTLRDHKGRSEYLHGVTHWAPLLGPELE